MEHYEYAVISGRTGELWRGPMPKRVAEAWVSEFIQDGGKPGAFEVGFRTTSEWKKAENATK